MLNLRGLELKHFYYHMRANELKWVCYLQSSCQDFLLTLFTLHVPLCLFAS